MKEVVPGIWTWSWFSEDKQMDFNGHYVRGREAAIVVDPPVWAESDLAQMEQLGAPACIVVTNRHHARRSRELAAHFRVPIRIHEADAALVEPPLDGPTFHDGELLPGGVRAVALTDMKSPGETALHVAASSAVILGDALIGTPAGALSLLPPPKVADPSRASASLRRLLAVPFEALLLGDGVSLPARGRAELEKFLARSPSTP